MKKFFLVAVLALGVALTSFDADAARFGGGASFGRSAPSLMASPRMKAPQAAPKAPAQNAKPAAQAPRQGAAPAAARGMGSRLMWGIAGMLGIAALASWLGLGEGFVMFLTTFLLMMALFFVVRAVMGFLFYRHAASAAGPSNDNVRVSGGPTYGTSEPQPYAGAAQPAQADPDDEDARLMASQKKVDLPPDFDVEGFLKTAEDHFVRMQKAWDEENLDDIMEFTDKDVYIELAHQLRERGDARQKTEIVTLKSDFRGIVTDGPDYLAGVHFDGVVNSNGKAERVDETWILSKPIHGKGGWVLAGIHQEGL